MAIVQGLKHRKMVFVCNQSIILIKALRSSQPRILPSFQFYKFITMILPKNVQLAFGNVKVIFFPSEVKEEKITSTPNVSLLSQEAKPASPGTFQMLSMKSNISSKQK